MAAALFSAKSNRALIKSARSHPNLLFDTSRCDPEFDKIFLQSSIIEDENRENVDTTNSSQINPNMISIEIPTSESNEENFQRNTIRKSRKRYRAPLPPASSSTLSSAKHRNRSLDISHKDIGNFSLYDDRNDSTTNHDKDEEMVDSNFSRSDVRMSVSERKAIFEKQLKFRPQVNNSSDVVYKTDRTIRNENSIISSEDLKQERTKKQKEMGANNLEMRALLNKKSSAHQDIDDGEIMDTQFTKSAEYQKEVKRPFIPPPPPPPQNQRNETSIRTESHATNRNNAGTVSDGKDDKNGCDTCVDWILFLLCIA